VGAPLLNVDGGEHASEPVAIYVLAHLVNVACGGHAGDDASMRRVVRACAAAGTQVGAHPSYPDRAGFGRVRVSMPVASVRASVRAQCAALRAAAGDVPIRHVKPHGALYHDADVDPALAAAVLDGALEALGAPFAVLGPPGGALAEAAVGRGLRYLVEGFADRGVRSDSTLIPRGEPGALVTDPVVAAARARSLRVDTVCVHADTPGALAIARAVRAVLDAA
jgi:UPF0271 protein